VRLFGHRQTKEAATDKPSLKPPRHISMADRWHTRAVKKNVARKGDIHVPAKAR
jgi:hypothetical protein